ncbi:MAG: isoleucine--tRNA ligase [Candidatus Omnitrophota bacterium]
MDYKDTLNLPRTDFKMKASLTQKEPQVENTWQDLNIYSKIRAARSKSPKYVLHDGPPYANGNIHIGHVLNKVIKDIIIKYKTMQNLDCAYVPGWDCHGLPVELQLFKKLNISKHEIRQVEFRKKAHEYAMDFVRVQKDEFKRLGIFGEWDNPYLTLSREYEEAIVRSFAKLVKKGYIYRGSKPVNWCYRCETALAEAEVEYEDHTSPSVYVKFKLNSRQSSVVSRQFEENTYIVIWTTTPWTLIANVAVAVHPDFDYCFVKTQDATLVMAKDLAAGVMQKIGISDYNITSICKGVDLKGLEYDHPFGLRKGRIVTADYVSLEEGTGCVHTAPGHGEDDHVTGLKHGLEIIMPVDEKGNFTDQAGEFSKMNVHKADKAIIEKLKIVKLLLFSENFTHSYPHCWRCKNPIIFRATEQWFMSIDKNNMRQKLLEAIESAIGWIPPQGKDRIYAMAQNRPDWCLSRQRYWGSPIPVFQCESCKEWICDSFLIEYFADIVAKDGTDAWFANQAKDLMPPGFKCPKCAKGVFKKGSDIIDVWFESGVSHQAVLRKREALGFPAQLYVEGSDQHRGWFQSSLITAIAIEDKPPFKSVLTHGFVVDGEGRKMSKSLGNVISPQDVIKDYGADILRLWVASTNYTEDVRISDEILSRLTESYRKIRNTARYILGNLYDFSFQDNRVSYEQLLPIDKWALSEAHSLLKESIQHYEGFFFYKVYKVVYNFCVVTMSNFYLDILKDRLYTFGKNSTARRSAQTALYEILNILNAIIAPLLAFTAEEIYSHAKKEKGAPESIHLCLWPMYDKGKIDNSLQEQWQRLIGIRETVLKVLEQRRAEGVIGNSLEAGVSIYTESGKEHGFLSGFKEELASVFIVSQVTLHNSKAPLDAVACIGNEIFVLAYKAKGEKCPRCWNYSITIGKDKRHPTICERCIKAIEEV